MKTGNPYVWIPLLLMAGVLVFGSVSVRAQDVLPTVGVDERTCDPEDPELEGPPEDAPPGTDPTMLVRNEPDGTQTVILHVDDPADDPDRYLHFPLDAVPPSLPVDDANVEEVGTFAHRWPTERVLVTYGLYVIRNGQRTRIPLFILENGVYADSATGGPAEAPLGELAFAEMWPLLFNGTPYALNVVAPTPTAAAGLIAGVPPAGPVLASSWFTHFHAYPADVEYRDRRPVYIWTQYRKATGTELWSGSVVMHNGEFSETQVDGQTFREGCRRTRIGQVVRNESGTTYLGGAFLLDWVRGWDDPEEERFEARQDLVAGATAGTSPEWTDVPVTRVSQREEKEGDSPVTPGQRVVYPRHQRDQIALGAEVDGRFVPLVGIRSDTWHFETAPNCRDVESPDAQCRVVSIGVFDPFAQYHPVAGGRAHFERFPGDQWLFVWALTGGPGTQVSGDATADVGVFGPEGSFVPAVGVTYDDEFEQAQYEYQMMVTAGVWVVDDYNPVLGVTYDGERLPLLMWAAPATLGASSEDANSEWLSSAGVFTPVGYTPVVGASGKRTGAGTGAVLEEYRVGVFPLSYPDLIPLVGADWRSDRPSGDWVALFAVASGKAPSDARVDAGPAPGGPLVPVTGIRVDAGRPDRYAVGAWAGDQFVPVAEACVASESTTFGLALGGGSGRVPLLWLRPSPSGPAGAPLEDCPS